MSEATLTILWVGVTRDPRQQQWEARIEAAGLHSERVDDVYVALARLGRGKVNPAAVVVCVDFLDPSESEFFELVTRYHRGVPVYACGCPEAAEKLDAAMRAGARAVLTPEQLEKLAQELGGSEASAAVSPGPTEPLERPSVEQPATEATDPTAPASPTGIRVPWRKGADAPIRTPPTRHPGTRLEPPGHESRDRVAESAKRDEDPEAALFDAPLLSPQELELLLKDDFRTRPAQHGPSEEDAD
ncbi:MAG: hypothetical protein V2A79_17965 [Planctomycetota bacterium]